MEPVLTLRLLLVGGDGAHKVLRGHVHLRVSVLTDDLQRRKVAEDLVGGGVRPDPVLILHNLGGREEKEEEWTQ